MEPHPSDSAILLIISGPTASGKTTLCDQMLAAFAPGIQRVVTSTTRAPRPGELHQKDYYFFSLEDFLSLEAQGAFYETANVHGRRYGTLKKEIESKLNNGIDCLLNIDVQGALAFFNAEPQDPLLKGRVHSVFIMPESLDVLRERLRARGENNPAEIERRLGSAQMEMDHAQHYEFRLHTTTKAADFQAIVDFYQSLKRSRA